MHPMPDHVKEDGRVIKTQWIIFIVAFILPILLFPLVDEHHAKSVGKMVDMLFITGTILLAVKLAREGWDLAAAGYTVLGIGWGILFAAIDFQDLHMDMEVRASAGYFFLPSMILIAYYKTFPWWIKGLTIWCIVPFAIALLLQEFNTAEPSAVGFWVLMGFNSFHLTSLFWAFFFYRRFRKQKKSGQPIPAAE